MRVILALALALFVGAIGYYIGRQTTTAAEDTSRSRTDQQRAEQQQPSAPPPSNVATPPAAAVETPPAVETGPGAGPAPIPSGAENVSASTASVNPPLSMQAAPADPGPLADRNLGLPIANVTAKDIHDTFDQARGNGERRHEAADIMAPRGTPVLAVDNGLVQKLFTSKPGGLTVYQMDSAEKYIYYYAHLDRYAPGLKEGQLLKKGDLVGYVGVTGNSDPNAPHLHFAIFEVGPEKKWYSNLRPVNPYSLLMSSVQRQISRSGKR